MQSLYHLPTVAGVISHTPLQACDQSPQSNQERRGPKALPEMCDRLRPSERAVIGNLPQDCQYPLMERDQQPLRDRIHDHEQPGFTSRFHLRTYTPHEDLVGGTVFHDLHQKP